MTDIVLTDRQAEAIRMIVDWFNNRTAEQQVFRLFGFAGTGKTTIMHKAIEALNFSVHDTEVMFGAFTGKASLVMRRHGLPRARTIHSMIYSVSEATEAEIDEANKLLVSKQLAVADLAFGSTERFCMDAEIGALELRIKDMKKPRFGLNEQSEVRDAKLVVLDEVSMVGQDMAKDLLSFEKPILVLGDPGQLPPIRGEGAFTMQNPDIMLTEIHRQAAESPIIRLATMARQGQPINFDRYSEAVWKMHMGRLTPEQMLKASQVICGKNATRRDLNNRLRSAAGFDIYNPLPVQGEKLICLKNDGERDLINGMFLEAINCEWATYDVEKYRFMAQLRDADDHGNLIAGGAPQMVYGGHFLDQLQFDEKRLERDYKTRKKLIEATFGWAITCHKAQGSQWENVIVWDDGLGQTQTDRNKWLYTAITRAESGLIIMA